MASHFSANQYENGFDSKRLQNWQLPKTYKERPSAQDGFTQIIANERGHLLGGVPRSTESPWGQFVGTWDMPKQIPGNVTTSMARSKPAVNEIERTKQQHEAYMRQATGSPTKDVQQTTALSKSPDERPGNPSPHTSQENPASKSPTQKTPNTPNPSPEEEPIPA